MTPTLDALADQPDLARSVPRETLMKAMMACAVALMGEPAPAVAMSEALDDTMTSDEAARLLGVSVSTLRHGASQQYRGLRVQNGTRKLCWSRDRIAKFMRRR